MPGIGIGPNVAFLSGAGPWFPLRETGCVEWYKSTMGVTVTADIARWLDVSGTFAHVSQDTAANKPALSGTSLEFAKATSEYLSRAVIAGIDNGYTVGIALQFTSAVGSAEVVVGNTSGANGMDLRRLGGGNRNQNHGGVASVSWGASTTVPETWVARHDGAGGNADFALNGAHQVQQALANNGAPAGGFAVGGTGIGGSPTDARVWAVVAYSARLSDADTVLLSTYLTALRDGTTPTAWRPSDVANLVLWLERPDLWAGSHVSAWANQGTAGAARDLAQATATKRMVLCPGAGPNGGPALHADGVDDYLRGTWTQAQPTHLFTMGLVSQDGAGNDTLLDGGSNEKRLIYTPAGNNIAAWAGANLVVVADPKQWHRIETLWNGASSNLRIDDLAPSAGNVGAGAGNGLTIGLRGNEAGNPADCLITEIFEYDRNNLSANAIAQAHAYLTKEYGI